MNDEARLLYALWESITDYVPNNDKADAAASLIRALMESNSNDLHLMQDAEDICPYLDRALAAVVEEHEDETRDLFDEYEE